jgi:hypothetical protein
MEEERVPLREQGKPLLALGGNTTIHHRHALPMEEDRVPLREQGNSLRAPGGNVAIHHSEREISGVPCVEAGIAYDDEGYDRNVKYGGDRRDEVDGHEYDDRYYDPQPLRSEDIFAQTGRACATEDRRVVRNAAHLDENESEELRRTRVTKRQLSTALVATEQSSSEEIKMNASKTDAAQCQIVQEQLPEVVYQSYFGHAPGKFVPIPNASSAARDRTKHNADSVTSRGSAQVVHYVDDNPHPRYAQSLSQRQATYDNHYRDDIRHNNNNVRTESTEFQRDGRARAPQVAQIAPLVAHGNRPLKTRNLEQPDGTVKREDSEVSRSMRGHRRTGPVPIRDESDNLTHDLGAMMTGTGHSTEGFCSTESTPAKREQEMSIAFGGPPPIAQSYDRENDHSRSLRKRYPARQGGQNEDAQPITNDPYGSSQRMAVENDTWGNEAHTRGDGTTQLAIMDPRECSDYYFIGEGDTRDAMSQSSRAKTQGPRRACRRGDTDQHICRIRKSTQPWVSPSLCDRYRTCKVRESCNRK